MRKYLMEKAKEISGKFLLNSFDGNSAGRVGSALETVDNNIYTGISINLDCGLSLCAEVAAVAEMLKNRETCVKAIISIKDTGDIIPPCGRCRELLMQVNFDNKNTIVYLSKNRQMLLSELLPIIYE